MSTGLLFAMGVLVTVLVAIGVALPVYGAILDGRYQAEQRALSKQRPGRRPAARRKELEMSTNIV